MYNQSAAGPAGASESARPVNARAPIEPRRCGPADGSRFAAPVEGLNPVLYVGIAMSLVISWLAYSLMSSGAFGAVSGITSLAGFALSIYTIWLVGRVHFAVAKERDRLIRRIRVQDLAGALSAGLRSLSTHTDGDRLDEAFRAALQLDADLARLDRHVGDDLRAEIRRSRQLVVRLKNGDTSQRKARLCDLRDELVGVVRHVNHLKTDLTWSAPDG